MTTDWSIAAVLIGRIRRDIHVAAIRANFSFYYYDYIDYYDYMIAEGGSVAAVALSWAPCWIAGLRGKTVLN
jgi:hypothetical protein